MRCEHTLLTGITRQLALNILALLRRRVQSRAASAAVMALIVVIASCRSEAPTEPEVEVKGTQPNPADAPCFPTPNYVRNATSNIWGVGGRLMRWREFPVDVAVDSATLSLVENRAEWEEGIRLGLQAWHTATGDSIGTITFVSDTSAADIVVQLSRLDILSDCVFLGCLGEAQEVADGRYFIRVLIILYPEGAPEGGWSRSKVAQVTAHEMGHALGLMFHSLDPADLMFRGRLTPPAPDRYPWISQSDLHTMAIAYCTP